MSGTRNALAAGGVFRDQSNPLMASAPTMADAYAANMPVLRDAWAAARDPQTWQDAAQQYANALLMGTTAPGVKGITAYHGSPHSFDKFDLSKVRDESGVWLTSDPGTAKAFALDRAGVPMHNPKRVPVSVMETRISGNLQDIHPFDEATRIAEQIHEDAPKTWDDAANILQWADAQKGWISDAKDAGFDGVAFHNVGDSPNGSVSTHYVVFDPKNLTVVPR